MLDKMWQVSQSCIWPVNRPFCYWILTLCGSVYEKLHVAFGSFANTIYKVNPRALCLSGYRNVTKKWVFCIHRICIAYIVRLLKWCSLLAAITYCWNKCVCSILAPAAQKTMFEARTIWPPVNWVRHLTTYFMPGPWPAVIAHTC